MRHAVSLVAACGILAASLWCGQPRAQGPGHGHPQHPAPPVPLCCPTALPSRSSHAPRWVPTPSPSPRACPPHQAGCLQPTSCQHPAQGSPVPGDTGPASHPNPGPRAPPATATSPPASFCLHQGRQSSSRCPRLLPLCWAIPGSYRAEHPAPDTQPERWGMTRAAAAQETTGDLTRAARV